MSRTYRYRILNVFTAGGAFTGNPLCVFEDARGMPGAAMQALARQFNLSETTFLLPSRTATARVRIFTPEYEMPFAGHPTLGSAAVVSSLRRGAKEVTLEMTAGVIPVRRTGRGERWQLRARTPTWREPVGLAAERLLRIPVERILPGALWVDAGCEQLLVPLDSPEAVRAARPDVAAILALRPEDGTGQVYAFAESGPGRVEARFFFAQGTAVAEDPATGSACANLGGWHLAKGTGLPLTRTVSQGDHLGRPSLLRLDVDEEGAVRVSGGVREIGRGTIAL